MNHPNRKEIITVLVDGRTKAKLRRLAGDSYHTLSGYVRHLILAHIREAEALCGPIPAEMSIVNAKKYKNLFLGHQARAAIHSRKQISAVFHPNISRG